MPSTPDSILRTELQATGENATTWGIKTNNNIELLAEAVAGVANVNVGGSGDYTLVASNYVSDEARPATLVLTGTLSGNRDVIVPTSPKQYVVRNQTSGAFTLTIRQSAGTGVVVPQGTSHIVCTSTTCVDAIGASPFAKTFLDDVDAAAARSTLGLGSAATLAATSVGASLVVAADTSAARSVIGATSVGSSLITAADTSVARTIIGATSVGSSLIVAADAAAARTAIAAAADVDNRWVQLSSTAITATNEIDLTWTGGAYLLYKIYILGLRPGTATANDFFMRVRRGGSFIAGSTDYNNAYSWWNGTGVGNSVGFDSGMLLAQNGMNVEPLLGEISLMQSATTERIVLDAKTRHTSSSAGHSRSIFTSNIAAGSGWLDGARFTFVGGATNFAAVGKIVVLGLKS